MIKKEPYIGMPIIFGEYEDTAMADTEEKEVLTAQVLSVTETLADNLGENFTEHFTENPAEHAADTSAVPAVPAVNVVDAVPTVEAVSAVNAVPAVGAVLAENPVEIVPQAELAEEDGALGMETAVLEPGLSEEATETVLEIDRQRTAEHVMARVPDRPSGQAEVAQMEPRRPMRPMQNQMPGRMQEQPMRPMQNQMPEQMQEQPMRPMQNQMPGQMQTRPMQPMQTMVVGMAYVPWQHWQQPFDYETAFEKGTIFPDLDLPFLGYMGGRRR